MTIECGSDCICVLCAERLGRELDYDTFEHLDLEVILHLADEAGFSFCHRDLDDHRDQIYGG